MIINRNLPPIGMNQHRAGQSFHIKTNPNFGVGGMPTKGASNMSDAELRTAFEELAKRDFAAGKNLSQAYHGSEHQELMRLVASAASPDRRGIISNTLSDLSSKIQRSFFYRKRSLKCHMVYPPNLLIYLLFAFYQ